MNEAIEHILTYYFAGEYVLANTLLDGMPEMRAPLVAYVEKKYGWAKPYMEEIPVWGSPCDWVFGKGLNCEKSGIKELPALPAGLVSLNCPNNELTALPDSLPAGLKYLYCSNNLLTALPNSLPAGLEMLVCSNNLLTALPDLLPAGLESLFCSFNLLTSIPDSLPAGLKVLYCNNNLLTSLPNSLPKNLKLLSCSGNKLTEDPPRPKDCDVYWK